MVDEKERLVVRREGPHLFVLEEDEYCRVCEETEWSQLTWFQLGDSDPENPLKYCVCKVCMDTGKFHVWLTQQFEEALSERPDKWRKNPDGTWTEIDEGE